MTRIRIPDEVLSAAHDRARARDERNWAEADRLRASIEASGWKVVDRGTDFALSLAIAGDVVDGHRIRYGSSRNVPSRLDEAPVGTATVVIVATDWPQDLARSLAGLTANAPPGTSVVVAADGPSVEQQPALEALEAAPTGEVPIEVIWTSQRLGRAAALNVGLRRARGPVAVLLDASVEPTGDFVTPLVATLEDATVAIVGGWGIVTRDLRHFEEASGGEVDAIEVRYQAFRRADYAERGPLDERLTHDRYLDIWWSLILRDGGEGGLGRRALALDGLPIARHGDPEDFVLPEAERDRLRRRNAYRLIDRFGSRRDLLVHPG